MAAYGLVFVSLACFPILNFRSLFYLLWGLCRRAWDILMILLEADLGWVLFSRWGFWYD